ncbi:hypothetical protein BDZ89DRAFT_481267 [Hymenopellis radicata]|nr:hypothetical protein BDZ89DRAFT_481267 [Hymenopellis radicata]
MLDGRSRKQDRIVRVLASSDSRKGWLLSCRQMIPRASASWCAVCAILRLTLLAFCMLLSVGDSRHCFPVNYELCHATIMYDGGTSRSNFSSHQRSSIKADCFRQLGLSLLTPRSL